MKVLIPKNITQQGKEYLLARGYEIKMGSAEDEDTMVREVVDCDAILTRIAVSRKVMEAGKKLKVVARHGVGVDEIDVAAATELGIWVTNAPESNYEAVAEHAVALMLAVSHNIVDLDRKVRNEGWSYRETDIFTEMSGKTLGIIGTGRIGKAMAKSCALGFGMRVIGWNPRKHLDIPEYIQMVDDIRTIYREADVVALHVPSTPETRHSVDKGCFELMKPTAYLINTARGDIINEQDLYEALVNGTIKGAGLDVLEKEPPQKDNLLFSLSNVTLAPHHAAHSDLAFDRMGLHAAQSIDEVLTGKMPTWPVNHIK